MTTTNIKKECIPAIVAVMRESRQCFGTLSKEDGCFCALGCIAEAFRRQHPETFEWRNARLGRSRIAYAGAYGSTTALPPAVLQWIGAEPFSDGCLEVHIDGIQFVTLNDVTHKSLNEIADLLERSIVDHEEDSPQT